MNHTNQVFPRDAVRQLPAMALQLQDRTVEELKTILNLPEVHKLSFNESPYGPSPAAVAAIRQAACQAASYHNPESGELRTALAEFYGVSAGNIVLGSGADEIITLLAQVFLSGGDEAVIPVPTFGQYAAATALAGGRPVLAPVRSDMAISLAALLEALSANTKLIFLCNPNNPTGLTLDPAELKGFISQVPGHIGIVLDEAYAEYVCGEEYLSGISLLKEHPNVITVRTFSKVYGLAGLRLGYAIAQEEIAALLDKARNPFNISSLAQTAGLAALKDREYTGNVVRFNETERLWLSQELTKLGMKVYPSQTNFLFVDVGRNCQPLCDALFNRGIIIRPGTAWNLVTHIRVSLGNHRQNQLLVDIIRGLSR